MQKVSVYLRKKNVNKEKPLQKYALVIQGGAPILYVRKLTYSVKYA